jgi:hypothetical protein
MSKTRVITCANCEEKIELPDNGVNYHSIMWQPEFIGGVSTILPPPMHVSISLDGYIPMCSKCNGRKYK